MARPVLLRTSLLTVATAIAIAIGQRAEAQQSQFAAKFVIGTSKGEVLAPGQYFTAINVHNPTGQEVTIRKRFAVALPEEKPGPVSQFVSTKIPAGAAIEIDTRDIHKNTNTPPGTFVKGFVVIIGPSRLNVVGVYTAAGATKQIETMHMERVPASPATGAAGAALEAAPETAPGPAPATPD